jgi:outer membrane protein OmpA-like peptidoglycan-associated protein
MRAPLLLLTGALLMACGGAPTHGNTLEEEKEPLPPGAIEIVKYEQKTAELLRTTDALNEIRNKADEQRRRLSVICADHADHAVCAPQTAAAYARRAFCDDRDFTAHIDQVVAACHQGMCKQVDEAEQISRSDYMRLTTRLPHSLITFGAARTTLDRHDRKQLQQFIEAIAGEKGYVIIVGRASKDGPWRKNIQYALERAENTRQYLVNDLGLDVMKVGYITYGHEKMYLTELDAERLGKGKNKRLGKKAANRSALVFSYPCFKDAR